MDKGTPTEEITKDPVDEIVHYGGEVPQGHKDVDPNAPKGSKRMYQVNLELKQILIKL